jgi:cardiolipin synthase A/B
VLDRGFAQTLTKSFEQDRARSRRITLEECRRRPWRERFLERFAALFRSRI